jgi:hypothetical protein
MANACAHPTGPCAIGGLCVREGRFRVTATQTSVYYFSFAVASVADTIRPQECFSEESRYFRLPAINGYASS